ncbi:MAG: hypothetical protein JRH16_13065 [Deltaproteobacteria bacterium]|nr:hypothetical protein [Deltaproteobacteria bacterium]MBW2420861.1 hypothetical protein [Deltaproteobacteria bacterium]
MSTIVRYIGKGTTLRKIDDRLQNPSQQQLRELLDHPALMDIALLTGMFGESGRYHVENEGLGGPGVEGAHWPEYERKEAIVRAGFIKALRRSLATEPPKPIVSYWVSGLPTFEIVVTESRQQVTLLFLSPPWKEGAPPPASLDEDVWVIGSDDRIEALQAQFPKGSNLEQAERPEAADGVKIQRLRGW